MVRAGDISQEPKNLTFLFRPTKVELITQCCTYLTPTNDISSSAEHIDDLSFSLVAPLRSQNDCDFAVVIRDRATSFAITYQSSICIVDIVDCTI